ncbi:MAG TPA: protein kinase [Anaerolineales bacterium]
MEGWIGRTLSKVQIERPLGRGGMAEVYVGRHTTLNRPVAVKLLHAHLQEDADLKRRFIAEAQAVASLRHPNIVQVFDFDIVSGRPYIVMELLQGMSLAQYLAGLHASGLTLPLSTIAHLVDGIASALDYAHERGIVHRDIKPANIMLRQGTTPINPALPLLPDVQPVLTDFGVARLTTATTQTATGTVLGTPAYMSPEQIRGVGIDARSDIYSLGIVLYEMLAGDPPFNHDTTPAAVLVKHLQEKPPPVPQARPAVQRLMDRALAKDPNKRYPQAGLLAQDLRAAGGDTQAASRLLDSRQDTGVSRLGRIALFGLGGLLLLAVVVGGLAFGLRGQTPAAPAATSGPTEALAELPIDEPTASPETSTDPIVANPTPVPVDEPIGSAVFREGSLTAQLPGAPQPPAGFAYHVWLVSPLGQVQSLGPAQFSGNQLTFSYQGEGVLAAQAGQLLFSLEPDPDPNPDAAGDVVFQGAFDPEVAADLQLLFDVAGQTPLAQAVPQGLSRQVVHFDSHLNLILSSIDGGSLPSAKLHAEHVINISDGRDGLDYGDWNGDGRTENPGDDVGLVPYLRLLRTMLESSPASDPDQAEELISQLDELLAIANDTLDLATRVAAADGVAEVQPLRADLDSHHLGERVEAFLAQIEPIDLVLAVPIFLAP